MLYGGLVGGHADLSESVTRNPFTYEVPVLVSGVRFVIHEKQVWITDRDEYLVPLTVGEGCKLKGFAVTGDENYGILPCRGAVMESVIVMDRG